MFVTDKWDPHDVIMMSPTDKRVQRLCVADLWAQSTVNQAGSKLGWLGLDTGQAWPNTCQSLVAPRRLLDTHWVLSTGSAQ